MTTTASVQGTCVTASVRDTFVHYTYAWQLCELTWRFEDRTARQKVWDRWSCCRRGTCEHHELLSRESHDKGISSDPSSQGHETLQPSQAKGMLGWGWFVTGLTTRMEPFSCVGLAKVCKS